MPKTYVPDAGDVIWLEFDPQVGHEQKGKRPALVISPASYNSKAGLMLCCPITSKTKGYPFEVVVDTNPIDGVALVDQVRSLDWAVRNATRAGRVREDVLQEARLKIKALLGI